LNLIEGFETTSKIQIIKKQYLCVNIESPKNVSSLFLLIITKICSYNIIRLRRNTLQLAAGMIGEVNRAEAHQSEGGLTRQRSVAG
jgi:hypothetical protein